MKCILAALSISVAAAIGQTVTNGSFEVGPPPAGNAALLFAGDTNGLPGWTVVAGTVDYVDGRWQSVDGTRNIDLVGSSPGAIAQTISGFSVGSTYRLSFLLAGNPEFSPPTVRAGVSISGVSNVFSFNTSGRSANNMGWVTRGMDFVATNATLVLRFDGLDSGLAGAVIDGISIVAVQLPPLLSIRCSEVEVCWNSTSNLSYQVQYRSTLTTNQWVNWGAPITATNAKTCINDKVPAGSPQRYYQTIQLP